MTKLEQAGYRLNPRKSEIFKKEIEWVGHKWIQQLQDNLKAITKIDIPTNEKELKSFLREKQVLSKHIENLSANIEILGILLKNTNEWIWPDKKLPRGSFYLTKNYNYTEFPEAQNTGTNPRRIQSIPKTIVNHFGVVFNDDQIRIPKPLRKTITIILHKKHAAIKKTATAAKPFWWPKIKREFEQKCEKCIPCKMARRNIKAQIPMTETIFLPPRKQIKTSTWISVDE